MIRWDSVSCPWHEGTRDVLRGLARRTPAADRDDIAQSVAVAMLEHCLPGVVDAHPAGLAARITMRVAGKDWRRRKSAPVSLDAAHLAVTDQGLVAVEVRDLLACLPPGPRRVAERKVLEGRSLREIARLERLPLARIQRLWQSAQILLARELGDGGTEGRRDGGTEGRRDGGTEGRRARRGPRFSRILIQSGGSRALEGWTRGTSAHAA